ncbi:hypothetical protein PUN28_018441 [Cardiocondyla obscurior]|uniref:Uncharacterized protein n=1 Tax=Cardiocondyla obscurior TaxID=286306 RepID=A0AAW2EDU9_9HYME
MSTLRKKTMYNIINFIKWDNNTSIDCVPSTWILFDGEQQELVCKYMPPSYSTKMCKVLQVFCSMSIDSMSDKEPYNASKNKIKLIEKSLTKSSKQINKPVIIEDIILNKPIATHNLVVIINYLKQIVTEIQEIKYNQETIKNDLKNLKKHVEQNIINSIDKNNDVSNLMTQHKIKFSLENKDTFDKFNTLLFQDNSFRESFKTMITFIMDAKTLPSKNILAIIRKFLHKHLATKLTCTKRLMENFVDVFRMQNKTDVKMIYEKEIDRLIGAVLTNSKDWEKERLHTKNNNIHETDIQKC